MRIVAACGALACALALAACNTNPKDPVIVDTGSRPFDPCPPEARAEVPAHPRDPITLDQRNKAMIDGLAESLAIQALEYDTVTIPGWINRARARMAKTKEWCDGRKP